MSVDTVSRTSTRDNNFGLMRLLFASLVIISHAPAMVDDSQDVLVRTFGTMSFGEVAVDGFFLVSGYLISKSFASSPVLLGYTMKRIGRILPGYLVAFTLSFFLLAPWVGASLPVLSRAGVQQYFSDAWRLLPPYVPGVFPSMPYPDLDGPMWTIAYEARCYVGVAVLGLLFRSHARNLPLLAAFAIVCLAITGSGLALAWHLPSSVERTIGTMGASFRFAGIFSVGTLFYLLRQRLRFTLRGAVIAAAMLVMALPFRWTAEPAFAVFGGYLIFSAALAAPTSKASRWANGTDLSYGLYLYAWPIGNTIVYFSRHIDPFFLCCLTFMGAFVCAFASWWAVEKPSLRLARRVSRIVDEPDRNFRTSPV